MHERAGAPATSDDLIDVDRVIQRYGDTVPDPNDPLVQVRFGTSGHRGRSLDATFTDTHVAAITKAIVDYRARQGITGPVYVGADTHALSAPALQTVVEVLAGCGVVALTDSHNRPTPTPAVSHAIIAHNRHNSSTGVADGIIITPSHNPPADGGIKYNPPHGGPADDTVTATIAQLANTLLGQPGAIPRSTPRSEPYDYVHNYVADLGRVIDMDALRRLAAPLAVHPLGGASLDYWIDIASHWSVPIRVIDDTIDPQFGFMTLDHDGAIRMDPSSPYAMAVTDDAGTTFPLLVANDADADRHGIRCGVDGLMNPNHVLAVAIDYLLTHRPHWSPTVAVGKTMVSSQMIDRVVAHHGKTLVEVPVGFKWFGEGLTSGELCFGGEESAGAVCICRDGSLWVSEKDGIVMGLLMAEVLAVTGRDPASYYRYLEDRHGRTYYRRQDAPADPDILARLTSLSPESVLGRTLGADPVTSARTHAYSGSPLGGIRLDTDNGWIAARPSGTEPIYKIYAESYVSSGHLDALVEDAEILMSAGEKK